MKTPKIWGVFTADPMGPMGPMGPPSPVTKVLRMVKTKGPTTRPTLRETCVRILRVQQGIGREQMIGNTETPWISYRKIRGVTVSGQGFALSQPIDDCEKQGLASSRRGLKKGLRSGC